MEAEEAAAKDTESMSAIAKKFSAMKDEDNVLIKEYAVKLD